MPHLDASEALNTHQAGSASLNAHATRPRPTRSTLLGVVVVVGGVVMYLRFVKGWTLSDMMYVTKGAMTSMQESVNKGEDVSKMHVSALCMLWPLVHVCLCMQGCCR